MFNFIFYNFIQGFNIKFGVGLRPFLRPYLKLYYNTQKTIVYTIEEMHFFLT